MNKNELSFQVEASADDVAQAAVDIIIRVEKQSIAERGVFKIVFAGGTTPEKVYQKLSLRDCDWQRWYCYLGDERCLPAAHPDRNSQMLERTLFKKVQIPEQNIFHDPCRTREYSRGPDV